MSTLTNPRQILSHMIGALAVSVIVSGCQAFGAKPLPPPASWDEALVRCIRLSPLPNLCPCVYRDLEAHMNIQEFQAAYRRHKEPDQIWLTVDQAKQTIDVVAGAMAISNDDMTRQLGYAMKACLPRQ